MEQLMSKVEWSMGQLTINKRILNNWNPPASLKLLTMIMRGSAMVNLLSLTSRGTHMKPRKLYNKECDAILSVSEKVNFSQTRSQQKRCIQIPSDNLDIEIQLKESVEKLRLNQDRLNGAARKKLK